MNDGIRICLEWEATLELVYLATTVCPRLEILSCPKPLKKFVLSMGPWPGHQRWQRWRLGYWLKEPEGKA